MMPLGNPLGFGASDILELALALVLAGAAFFARGWIEPLLRRFAARTAWCMLFFALLPVALRLVLLPNHPVPTPDIYDEFSHLLEGDTLRHFRFANPPLLLPQFFETFFVLQEPAYSSIYPMGQGLMLELGKLVFGIPWAGVVISVACFCSLAYWMLRGWTTPLWAFAGGLLAVFEFGPLNQWMNSYWGGAFSAAAGCLVFGALPRLQRERRLRDAALVGAGFGLHFLARPYESIFLALAIAAFFAPELAQWRGFIKPAAIAVAAALPALMLALVQNRQVTGSWTTLPYTLSQYQYGVPASLTFQPQPVAHRELTREQQLDYRMQSGFRGAGPETFAKFLLRLEYRVRFYRFYFLPPLYLALVAFLATLGQFRYAWVAGTLALFAFGTNFFPAFQFHYLAAVVCLFLLVSVVGLQQITRLPSGGEAARVLFLLCVAHFVLWYGMHVFDTREFSREMRRFETWNSINHENPERRIAVSRELAKIPGKVIVFVRYWPQHIFQEEWVFNEADLAAARVIWARDLGEEENRKLMAAYPGREVYLLEADARPVRLLRY